MNAVELRQSYCQDTDVRARIREFIGATTVHESSCEFLAASDENAAPPSKPYPARALNSLLASGFEISRSLWDHDPSVTMTNARRGRSYLRNLARRLLLQRS